MFLWYKYEYSYNYSTSKTLIEKFTITKEKYLIHINYLLFYYQMLIHISIYFYLLL